MSEYYNTVRLHLPTEKIIEMFPSIPEIIHSEYDGLVIMESSLVVVGQAVFIDFQSLLVTPEIRVGIDTPMYDVLTSDRNIKDQIEEHNQRTGYNHKMKPLQNWFHEQGYPMSKSGLLVKEFGRQVEHITISDNWYNTQAAITQLIVKGDDEDYARLQKKRWDRINSEVETIWVGVEDNVGYANVFSKNKQTERFEGDEYKKRVEAANRKSEDIYRDIAREWESMQGKKHNAA